jgi:hypothetical protein
MAFVEQSRPNKEGVLYQMASSGWLERMI